MKFRIIRTTPRNKAGIGEILPRAGFSPAFWLALAAIMFLAAGLDLWGITWGLPNASHFWPYHPDESSIVDAARRIDPGAGIFTPGFYNYGSLFIYCVWLALHLGEAMGFLQAHPTSYDPSNEWRTYLAARLVAVIFSLGAVALTAFLGHRLFGRNVGALAAFLLAVSPLFCIHSHYATVDVPASFWMVASMLLAVRAMQGIANSAPPPGSPASRPGGLSRDRIPPAALLFSSAAAGLAAGTKYNAGIAILAPLLVWFTRQRSTRGLFHTVGDLLFGWVICGAVALAAFLVSTPGVLLEPERFSTDFQFEVWHQRTGHDYLFSQTAPAFIYHITHSLWTGLGPPLCAFALVGLLWALFQSTRSDFMIAVVALPYYLVIGLSQVKFMRYAIPLLPFLAIWAARLTIAGVSNVSPGRLHGNGELVRRGRVCRTGATVIFSVALILSIGFALLETVAYDRIMAGRDVRDRAESWIQTHLPSGTTIGTVTAPWYDTPPLFSPNFGPHLSSAALQQAETAGPYRIILTGWNVPLLNAAKPDYFVLDEFQVRYRLRLSHLRLAANSQDALAGAETARFLAALDKNYRRVATFESVPAIGPLRFRWSFEPEDWLYPHPTIWIYKRR